MVSLASPAEPMPPPPTTPRRPAMSLKRSSSYLDSDDARVSSPSKKLKVAFDPKVDVRIMEDWTDRGFDLIREEVRVAIERHTAPGDRRDDTQYLQLIQMLEREPFSDQAVKPAELSKHFLALETRISALGECRKLATAAINTSWLGRSEAFVNLYIKFLCDLASAHASLVPRIMESLVSYFSKLPTSTGRLPDEQRVLRSTMFSRLHSAVNIMLRQIPSADDCFMRAARSQFPDDLAESRSYSQFQKHLLRVSRYAPELKYEIIVLIVQRLVGMDVQIQMDFEDFEDEEEERFLTRGVLSQSNGGQDTDESDDESVSETDLSLTEDEQRVRDLRLKIANMDQTLDLLFDYYTPLIRDGSRPETNEAYNQLLSHFTSYILPTRSRHAQFLLFHFAQTSPAHSEYFVNRCLSFAGRDGGQSMQRLTALAYLSSFVARGAHLTSSSVQSIVFKLCQTLDEARRKYEPSCCAPDRRYYSVYYAIAQALLYIFCFRWRDLVTGSSLNEPDSDALSEDDAIAEGRDLSWMPGLKETMTKNIYSRLNPLKVCSQEIVVEFAKIAHHLRFIYVFPLLETNRRVRLGQPNSYYGYGDNVGISRRETAWDRQKGESHHQLEAYFPFDPYHLPDSKRWIATDYNEWKLPAGMGQADDVDEYLQSDDEPDSDDELFSPLPSSIEV